MSGKPGPRLTPATTDAVLDELRRGESWGEFALRVGAFASVVTQARKRGITLRQLSEWTIRLLDAPPAWWGRLRTDPIRTIAREEGVSENVVLGWRKRLNIRGGQTRPRVQIPSELVAQLGVLPDVEIAALAGVGEMRVARERQRLGIPARPWHPRRECPPDALARLGSEPDSVLVKELDVPPALVRKWRDDRGIPRFRRPRKTQ